MKNVFLIVASLLMFTSMYAKTGVPSPYLEHEFEIKKEADLSPSEKNKLFEEAIEIVASEALEECSIVTIHTVCGGYYVTQYCDGPFHGGSELAWTIQVNEWDCGEGAIQID